MSRLVLLATSPRVAPGLLSPSAWRVLTLGPVFAAEPADPLVLAVTDAGIEVRPTGPGHGATAVAAELLAATRATGAAVLLVGSYDDRSPVGQLVDALTVAASAEDPVEIERLDGSWDLPGARLLDVVTTMDRLRAPGGCPWDAKQDHASLAPYLLEEAYEAFQAIEDGDLAALRDELGDVLLQVAFHARMAEELPAGERWTVDDVASGLVDKLVRRHPHVFADTTVDGAEAVSTNWEAIKAAERGGASVVSSVPLSSPALTLASTLQRKAARVGFSAGEAGPADAVAAALAGFHDAPTAASAGELLWALVALLRTYDIDAETALRARARQFRDQVAATEAAYRAQPGGSDTLSGPASPR